MVGTSSAKTVGLNGIAEELARLSHETATLLEAPRLENGARLEEKVDEMRKEFQVLRLHQQRTEPNVECQHRMEVNIGQVLERIEAVAESVSALGLEVDELKASMSPDFMQRNEQTKKMKAFFLGGVHPVTWDSVEAMDRETVEAVLRTIGLPAKKKGDVDRQRKRLQTALGLRKPEPADDANTSR